MGFGEAKTVVLNLNFKIFIMKNIKYSIILLVGVCLLAFNACQNVTDLNIDPNNPTAVPAENLVTQAQYDIAARMWSRNYNGEWTMLMVQHWSQNEYCEESRYEVDGNSFDGVWQDIYANALKELNTAEELVSADNGLEAGIKANQLAIIKILEVCAYHLLVDGFGDLPFTQALNPDEYPSPSYDNQQTIYTGLVENLRSAISSIDTNSGSFDSGDIIYGGDAASWATFGNSLLLRIAMRMSDVDQATATSVINGISGSFISSNSQNALFRFSDNPDIANPLYIDKEIAGRDDFCVSDVLVNALQERNDPRISAYASVTNSGTYEGMPYGLEDADAFAIKSITSRPSERVRSATEPAIFMDYAEVQFLLAEAYERGILSGDAAAAYDAGVTASMEYWGFDDSAGAITDYLAANPYDSGNWKAVLGMQKWLAFYSNGPQAWAEWRRLGEPQLAVPDAAFTPTIPVRLPYPISEQTRNGSALNAVTDNPDDLGTRLWWDMN